MDVVEHHNPLEGDGDTVASPLDTPLITPLENADASIQPVKAEPGVVANLQETQKMVFFF